MPLISDSIGRVLGKRYRLVSALGTGASAHVYLAEDVSLQRHVAVKILQPALASDEAFLKRFRAEARSVASLNHPHVLRVFDWGEDADGPYLVLEYLGGGTLRDMLDQGVTLSHAQAARLGAEVAQGLAYAHARGLVHRDIKPANLLFDEEGRVRVADFGVARALAEAAYTEPEGAMVGTARYAAPEAAEGKPVDGKADVYSLGLVLYESVTGTVPFVTDTTVGTLMARVGAPLPHNALLGPLDDVLARAAAPNAAARLDAAGLSARLAALSSALPLPAPLPLHVAHPDQPAQAMRHRETNQGEMTEIVAVGAVEAPTQAVDATAVVGAKSGPDEVFDLEAFAGPAPKEKTPADGGGPTIAHRTKRRRWPWVVALVVLVLALGAAAFAAVNNKVFVPSHPTPALTGLTVAQSQRETAHLHFHLVVDKATTSITVGAGHVISQHPAPGHVMKQGSSVTIVPSAGPPPTPVPSLTGLDCAGATAALAAAHLTGLCPAASAQYSSTVPSGQVISWSYGTTQNPTSAPYGAAISIVTSNGHAPVTVPAIASTYTFAQAQAALQAVGLVAVQVNHTSTTVPSGTVISVSPAPGASAPYGSNVTVTVSSGPPTVAVPPTIGDTVTQATSALQAAGLTVGGTYGPNATTPGATVVSSDPGGGVTVNVGSAVNLYTD